MGDDVGIHLIHRLMAGSGAPRLGGSSGGQDLEMLSHVVEFGSPSHVSSQYCLYSVYVFMMNSAVQRGVEVQNAGTLEEGGRKGKKYSAFVQCIFHSGVLLCPQDHVV